MSRLILATILFAAALCLSDAERCLLSAIHGNAEDYHFDRDEVLLNPQEEYTRRLLAAAPVPNPIEQKVRREERHALLKSLGDGVVELDTRELQQ